MNKRERTIPNNYLHKIIENDIDSHLFNRPITTRFPPEPNGFLHIGSAFAINISHGAALKFGGNFNLRFDDTNPTKEDIKYVEAIKEDMLWLGFDWKDRLFFGSDYFHKIYKYAERLIMLDRAYVCELSQEDMRVYRGTLKGIGKNSPYRHRSVEENLKLFREMRGGTYDDGAMVLRAKIDMTSANICMRDPVIFRILHVEHFRTGGEWVIYPMYDFAHPLQDYIEGVTHSMCSSEFINNRELYNWVLNAFELPEPSKQREFGRMGIKGVRTSKRYLRELVEGDYVDGWDDPRMPTLKGMKRKGIRPRAIINFLDEIGVGKSSSIVDPEMLNHFIREDLKQEVPRVMTVIAPLKVTITNLPEGHIEWMEIENNTDKESGETRSVPFTKELYIEKEDFKVEGNNKYKRLKLNGEVRLKGAYFIKCNNYVTDESGEIIELLCTYDKATKSGSGFSDRKVKGTIHWVSKSHGVAIEIRNFEDLLLPEKEDADKSDWKSFVNPESLTVIETAITEPYVANGCVGNSYQFLRHGYYAIDSKYTHEHKLVFNRVVSLKSSWKR